MHSASVPPLPRWRRARRYLGSDGADVEHLMAGLEEAERLLLDRLEPAG